MREDTKEAFYAHLGEYRWPCKRNPREFEKFFNQWKQTLKKAHQTA